jgi:Domain of unknown function (DUF5069)
LEVAGKLFGLRELPQSSARCSRRVARKRAASNTFRMTTYPKSPREMTKGMLYFPRMLDKIRLHLCGELHHDYQENFGGPKAADGVCCNFLRVHHRDLIERVKQGGTDEEILEWCFEKGRRLNEGDLFVWNGFASKLGWRDSVSPRLQQRKKEAGIADRDDILTIPDLIDFDEGRLPQTANAS